MHAEVSPGGLTLPPGLHVSFQRYARPLGDVIAQSPSSLGALPVALGASREFALPVAPDEAFWIGLEMTRSGTRAEVAVRFVSPAGVALDALSGTPWKEETPTWITVPPHPSIEGIAIATGGFRPFARTPAANNDEGTATLDVVTRAEGKPGGPAATRILLVSYDRFESMTGRERPATLDADAQYQGWLLP